jgi:beta-glucosidase
LDLRRINSIAVLGTYATVNQLGSYNSNPNQSFSRGPSVLDSIKAAVGDRVIVRSAVGADYDASAEAARQADVAIVIVGLDSRTERAGSDRPSLELGYDQKTLLEKVSKANPLTVVVLEGGSCIAFESYKERFPAILMAWYPGEQGGNAMAQVLLGQSNPSGRLPVTFYRSLSDLPPMDDYEVVTGRTYLYCKKPVTFPFGHGLSYTNFEYNHVEVEGPADGAANVDGTVRVSVEVANTGGRDGDEVVEVYARTVQPAITRPIKQLVAFERVSIPKGESRAVRFNISTKGLAYWDTEKHQFAVDAGAYEFLVGASSEDIRGKGSIELK